MKATLLLAFVLCSPSLALADVRKYDILRPIPQSEMVELLDPGALGAEVLQGNPRAFIRVDYATPTGQLGGIFEVTRGKLRIRFPFTEHATIISGVVKITDASGRTQWYFPGDSYFITQGSVVIWETVTSRVQKSFFNITTP